MAQADASFAVRPAPELTGGPATRAQVIVVGAGPVGLALAVDLALHGVRVVLVDESDRVAQGSRAICWAKRSLEILDRLGVGERMKGKGVTWKVGRLFHGEREIFHFDLQPEEGSKMPAFVNLQQSYVERFLGERCTDFPDLIDLRWKNRLIGIGQDAGGAVAEIETPEGCYALRAPYLVACDGARSPTRALMGLALEGESFEDRFLIADIEMRADLPPERWFWFEPPFHPGRTALLHKQPDDIWRIDLQLGPDADPEAERRPEAVILRIEKAVGGRPFRLDWVSVYAFACRRLARFVHGRVIFAGDAAHVVSPFGARGGNGGIHDADNLGWKLAAVLAGEAGPGLLASYDAERGHGADENMANSTRATRFMMASGEARGFRDAVLALAPAYGFARGLVNSGRLSVPCSLGGQAGITPSEGRGEVGAGDACPDARLKDGWLLERLGGGFMVLAVGVAAPARLAGLPVLAVPCAGDAARRYGRGLFLIRPDQHVAGIWPEADAAAVAGALGRARAGEGA